MNKNIESYNDKGEVHGYWEKYFTNGNIAFICYYVNGRLNGYEEVMFNPHLEKIYLNFHL